MRNQITSGEALWQWRQQARREAIAAAIATSEVDWLLQAVSALEPLQLKLETFKTQPTIPLAYSLEQLTLRWQQRINQRVPVQYLAGLAHWRSFTLAVSPAVLIPRPETELMIDLAIAAAQHTDLAHGDWADLGTGSGAIALGLAEVFPAATVHAVDCSEAALAIARQNAQMAGFTNRIRFHSGSWFQPLTQLQGSLSGMVSNPPYIPTAILPGLQPEVSRHEPHLALDGGDDGLVCVRHLVACAPTYLKNGGFWLVELMAGQAIAVAGLLETDGHYQAIQIHRDLAGIERFVSATRKP